MIIRFIVLFSDDREETDSLDVDRNTRYQDTNGADNSALEDENMPVILGFVFLAFFFFFFRGSHVAN